MFQQLYFTLRTLNNSEKVQSWKSKGFLTEKLTTSLTTDNSLSPAIKWHKDLKFCVVFKGSCLKQKNVTYTALNRIFFFLFFMN